MSRASRAPRSRASPKTPPTASWRRPSGMRSARPARHRSLQGDQHGRLDDRPQIRALSSFRLGGGAARRSGQPAGLAPDRAAVCGGRRHRSPDAASRRCRCDAPRRQPSARPMPAGPKQPLPRASVSGSAAPAPMTAKGRSCRMGVAGRTRRNDIRRGLRLYGRALTLLFAAMLLLALIF